jgi:hypothetical protein
VKQGGLVTASRPLSELLVQASKAGKGLEDAANLQPGSSARAGSAIACDNYRPGGGRGGGYYGGGAGGRSEEHGPQAAAAVVVRHAGSRTVTP